MPVPDFSQGEVLTASAMDQVGMWKITEVTFSGQTQVDFDDIFTSNYSTYRIAFDSFTSSGTINILMRLRDSGGNIASSVYTTQRLETVGSTVSAFNLGTNITEWLPFFVGTGTAAETNGHLDIFKPNISSYTRTEGSFVRTDSTTDCRTVTMSGLFNATTVITGFSILRSSTATISGTVRVYGYRS